MPSFLSPKSGKSLVRTRDFFQTEDGAELFHVDGNVVRFLDRYDKFYEGAYLNRIKYKPLGERWPFTIPLWILSCGYIWEVRKSYKAGAVILELGCAGGVDYFGSRFKMIGLDLSFESLRQLNGYQIGIQASASDIPLADQSVDGIISSFFWEHIDAATKDKMLAEFKRVLKPGGKLVFLYDVESDNTLISGIRSADQEKYQKLFKDGDGHIGYASPAENYHQFNAAGFSVLKHFGMERTWLQSVSVYEKMRHFQGLWGGLGRFLFFVFSWRFAIWGNLLLVRLVDESIGRLLPLRKSRIIITVARKS